MTTHRIQFSRLNPSGLSNTTAVHVVSGDYLDFAKQYARVLGQGQWILHHLSDNPDVREVIAAYAFTIHANGLVTGGISTGTVNVSRWPPKGA